MPLDTTPHIQPWLMDKRWKDNRIQSDTRSGILSAAIASVLCFGVGALLVWKLWPQLAAGQIENAAILVAFAFPAIGLFALADLLRRLLGLWKFGEIELQLDPFPGSLGQQVGGTFFIATALPHDTPCTIQVDCYRSYLDRSGSESTWRESAVWGERGLGDVRSAVNGTNISFCFKIPDNLPSSSEHITKQDCHLWRIRLSVAVPGVDITRRYDIPVFNTGETSRLGIDTGRNTQRDLQKQDAQTRFQLDAGNLTETPVAKNIRFYQKEDELILHHPMLRNKLLGGIALLFTLIPGIIAWNFIDFQHHDLFRLLFSIAGIIPAGIALLAGGIWIACWFNSLHVTIGQGMLRSTRSLFLIPIWLRRCELRQIQQVTIQHSGRSGQGSDRVEHFKIIAITMDGRRITVAESIDGQNNATLLQEYLHRLITTHR